MTRDRLLWVFAMSCASVTLVETARADEMTMLLWNRTDYEVSFAIALPDDSCEPSGFRDHAWYTIGPRGTGTPTRKINIDVNTSWVRAGAVYDDNKFVMTEDHSDMTQCLTSRFGGRDCYWSVPYDGSSNDKCSTVLILDRTNPFPDGFSYNGFDPHCPSLSTPMVEVFQTDEGIPFLATYCFTAFGSDSPNGPAGGATPPGGGDGPFPD